MNNQLKRKKKYGEGSYLDLVMRDKPKVAAFINLAYLRWNGDAIKFDTENLGPKLEGVAYGILTGLEEAVANVFGMKDGTGNTGKKEFDKALAKIAKRELPGGEASISFVNAIGNTAITAWQGTIDSSRIGEIPDDIGFQTIADAATFVLSVNRKTPEQVLAELR